MRGPERGRERGTGFRLPHTSRIRLVCTLFSKNEILYPAHEGRPEDGRELRGGEECSIWRSATATALLCSDTQWHLGAAPACLVEVLTDHPDLLPAGGTATQLARWAAQAATELAAADAPTHVSSASLIASVALRLALDDLDRVASLTVDSAQRGGPLPIPGLGHAGRIIGALTRRLPTRLVAAALLTQFLAYQGADQEAVRMDMLRLRARGIIDHLCAQLTHDVGAEIRSIVVPTVLLAGLRGALICSGAHRAFHAVLPHARLVEVPGAGWPRHLPRSPQHAAARAITMD